jgi:hypothetical protein
VRINPKRLVPFCAAALLVAVPAHALRVATWNLTAYQDGLIPSKITPRQADFRTSVAGLQPDVLIAQEVLGGSTSVDSFRINVLNFLQPGQWSSSYIASTESAVFWRTAVVSVTNVLSFATSGPRDVLECWVHPVGYTDKMATFRLFSIHLKAGTAVGDSSERTAECTDIRNTINNQSQTNYGPNFLIGGDTNFQGGFETGYTRLTESQANNNGQCRDTLRTLNSSQPTWHDNWFWRFYHSQSPCVTCLYNYFSAGGLDDRFDLFLTSNSVQDKQGLDLHGYIAYGQDGRHMNDDINASGNDSVGYTIATALKNSSDHIPVVAVIRLPAKLGAVSQLDFGTVITGATAEQSLAISNIAPWPADSLRYSFTAPAGFTAPPGTFAQAMGDPATNQTIGMSTASVGSPFDTLKINTNNPDTLIKRVLLSGKVIRHAVASLESLTVVLADSLDFGDLPSDSFPDLPVKIFNQGYDAQQARLSVNNGVITGGDGHFSIVGGFSGALVAGTPASYTIHFAPAGARLDSTYYATLTFSSADESLPGAQPQPDLVVTLRARPLSTMSPAKLSTASQLDFGTVITGATAEQALAISNIAPLPADTLRYSFAAPEGFSAPPGTFAQAAGDPPANQTIGMSTASIGSKSGALNIASNDPDSSSKDVLLSGKVLRHAAVSLDSLTQVLEAPLDFGDVPLFHDTTLVVAVHNLGYDPLQARLSITSAEIRGADTRYTLLDFSPTLVSGTGARFSVKFTASCESHVEAVDTLIFHSSDESLPGGAAQPDVRYLTIVTVTGVNPSLPTVTRLYKPVPNPLRSSSTLRFDLAQGTSAQLEVFDLAGRRVAVVADREFAPGRYSFPWDGRKDAGAPAGPGLYFVRLTGRGLSPQTVRLAIVR